MTTFAGNTVGGKAIYGASIGILMLEAQFPRIPGDMGNAMTWPFPVHYKVVRDATPDLVVRHQAKGLFGNFLKAAGELVADGVDGITTNCGFLALFQDELSEALNVPVATSSIMQVPMVEKLLPRNKRVGILTISPKTLTADHLRKAGCPLDTPIGGTAENTAFATAILNDQLTLDVDQARRENVDAALQLVNDHPDIGAIVLECTNMVPYASDIQQAARLPVFSIYSFISWFQSGLQPPSSFGGLGS